MNIGFTEIILVLAVVMIVFGAGKLPRVMGDLGKGLREFKNNMAEDDEEDEVKRIAPPKKLKSSPVKKTKAKAS
jgi:sec-independent protein translocase protein TatA